MSLLLSYFHSFFSPPFLQTCIIFFYIIYHLSSIFLSPTSYLSFILVIVYSIFNWIPHNIRCVLSFSSSLLSFSFSLLSFSLFLLLYFSPSLYLLYSNFICFTFFSLILFFFTLFIILLFYSSLLLIYLTLLLFSSLTLYTLLFYFIPLVKINVLQRVILSSFQILIFHHCWHWYFSSFT